MDKICLILGVDGYYVNGKFQVLELAFTTSYHHPPRSIHFQMNNFPISLTDRRLAMCMFCVHGLSVKPEESDLPQHMIPDIIKELHFVNMTAERNLVGFAGPGYLKDTLHELNIPFVDLAELGCPRYEELPEEPYTCGKHKYGRRCCTSKVVAYKKWCGM